MSPVDSWYIENLVCPIDKLPLQLQGDRLACAAGHEYPIVAGVPVLLPRDIEHTHAWASAKTFGIVDATLQSAKAAESATPVMAVDPFVQAEIANTNSNLYRASLGKLENYPIPQLPLPAGNGEYLLDIGCNWGRWCIAASGAGYQAVGIDPSLEAVLAANRVARQLGKANRYVVADSRYLPFRDNFFDYVYSYSVFQHFAKENVNATLAEIHRVLKQGGCSKVQMLNSFGLRSVFVQLRRGFRAAWGFETRYWTPGELKDTFGRIIGETQLEIASFFTQGQPGDMHLFLWRHQVIMHIAERLKIIARSFKPLLYCCDNLFVISKKR